MYYFGNNFIFEKSTACTVKFETTCPTLPCFSVCCAGSLYALRVLRADGLDEHSLRTVSKATTSNRILYAGPAWWGFADEADRTKIGRFMRRLLIKAGFTSATEADIDDSVSPAELKLLS